MPDQFTIGASAFEEFDAPGVDFTPTAGDDDIIGTSHDGSKIVTPDQKGVNTEMDVW